MTTVAVILAGGCSSRMGRDKAELELEGTSFLARLARRYRPVFDGVYVSSPRLGTYDFPGLDELPDLRPGQGPLAGLETAFLATAAQAVFLTAVDLPFGDEALARRLTEELGRADACLIQRHSGRLEPLFAVYRASCLPVLQACLDGGQRSVQGMIAKISCRILEETDLKEWNLAHILQNINTPRDYWQACRETGW